MGLEVLLTTPTVYYISGRIMHGNNYTKVKLGPKKVASIRNIEVAAFQGAVFYCHCEVGNRF